MYIAVIRVHEERPRPHASGLGPVLVDRAAEQLLRPPGLPIRTGHVHASGDPSMRAVMCACEER